MEKKTCTQCHLPKPVSEYGVRKTAKDGLGYVCKTCTNRQGRERYRKKKGGPVRDTPRRPLPEQAAKAGWGLRKDVERLESIFADDRFREHRAQIAVLLGEHLKHATTTCLDLLDRLETGERP